MAAVRPRLPVIMNWNINTKKICCTFAFRYAVFHDFANKNNEHQASEKCSSHGVYILDLPGVQDRCLWAVGTYHYPTPDSVTDDATQIVGGNCCLVESDAQHSDEYLGRAENHRNCFVLEEVFRSSGRIQMSLNIGVRDARRRCWRSRHRKVWRWWHLFCNYVQVIWTVIFRHLCLFQSFYVCSCLFVSLLVLFDCRFLSFCNVFSHCVSYIWRSIKLR